MTKQVMSDDDVLNYTLEKRIEFIAEATANGIPVSAEKQQVVLTALADMDRAALTKKKMGANERMAESNRVAAEALIKLVGHFGHNDPFKGTGGQTPIPLVLPTVDLTNGVTLEHDQVEGYEQFVKDVQSKME